MLGPLVRLNGIWMTADGTLRTLILVSAQAKLQAVIDAKGGHTRY